MQEAPSAGTIGSTAPMSLPRPMDDPFPSLNQTSGADVDVAPPPKKSGKSQQPDITSEDMFPSLGASQSSARVSAPKTAAPMIQRVMHQTTVSMHLSDEQLVRLSSLLQRVQQKCRSVKIEASTMRKTGQTKFIIKGASESAVQEAKRELAIQLAERVTLTMLIPASLRAFVIGAGGKNIRSITDDTGVRIHIPPRSEEQTPATDEPGDLLLGEQIEITIEGDSFNAQDAQARIQEIVAERTSKITQRLTHIEPVFFPFLLGPEGAGITALTQTIGKGEVSVKVPAQRERAAIVVSGERSLVPLVVQAIDAQVDDMRRSFRTISFNISKRQHAFLVGESASDILAKTQCSIELPPSNEPSEAITIRGPQSQLPQALTAAIERANAVAVETIDLHAMHSDADAAHFRHLLRWLATYAPREDSVQVFLPRTDAGHIEVVSEDADAARRIAQTIEHQLRLVTPPCVRIMEVDPLTHGFIIGKKAQNLRGYEARGVDVMLPPEHSGRDDVLLVYRRGKDAEEAVNVLDDVQNAIASAAAAAADLRTVHFSVPRKFHSVIRGADGTVLNALIGEDRMLVSMGGRIPVKTVSEPLTEDSIVVRGPGEAVARVVAQIQQMARDAEQDSIENGFVEEIQVRGSYLPHLIGRGGSNLIKLREELGVRFDVGSEESDRSKPVPVRITGRKECVAVAKERLLAQVERLADEVLQIIQVPVEMHGALIGQGGKYVLRLQDKYDVRIHFPHQGDSTTLKPNEVSIRGGRKGVAAARAELLELLEYEKENNHSQTITVSERAMPRVLGRAGATINRIRLESGALIDSVKSSNASPSKKLKLRGSREAVAAAEGMINAIIAEVESEAELIVPIPPEFHPHMIGAGGQRLHELIEKAGGPSDITTHTQMVRFPREKGNANVLVRAPHDLAHRIADVLKAEAALMANRVVYGKKVPLRMHSQMVMRGGRRHSPWQTDLSVQIFLPNWREYPTIGTPENADELQDAEPASIVKVVGPVENVLQVLDEMQSMIDASPRPRKTRAQREAMDARIDDVDR